MCKERCSCCQSLKESISSCCEWSKEIVSSCLEWIWSRIKNSLFILLAWIMYYSGLVGDGYALIQLYEADGTNGHFIFYTVIIFCRMLFNIFALNKNGKSHCFSWSTGILHVSRIFLEWEHKSIKKAVLSQFDGWQYFFHAPVETLVLTHWSLTSFHNIDYGIITITFLNSITSTYFLSKYDTFPADIQPKVDFSFGLLWKLRNLMLEHLLSTLWIWISWSIVLLISDLFHLSIFGIGALFVGAILASCFELQSEANLDTKEFLAVIFINIFGVTWISKKNFILAHRFCLLVGLGILFWFNLENLDKTMRSSFFYYSLSSLFSCIIGGFVFRRCSLWQPYFEAEYETVRTWYKKNHPQTEDETSPLLPEKTNTEVSDDQTRLEPSQISLFGDKEVP